MSKVLFFLYFRTWEGFEVKGDGYKIIKFTRSV